MENRNETYCGFEYFAEHLCRGCKLERFCEKFDKLIKQGLEISEARKLVGDETDDLFWEKAP